MIESNFDMAQSISPVRPMAPLEQGDFENLAEMVDPYIELHGERRGLIIEVSTFPGWENFRAMVAHFRFIRNHHQQIKKLAVVTNSAVGELAEHLTSHFVAAEIKHFPADEAEGAWRWRTNDSDK